MNKILYPKQYGIIYTIRPDGMLFIVRDDKSLPGLWVTVRQRNGYGPSAELVVGTRVKVYWRPRRPHCNFRRVGS